MTAGVRLSAGGVRRLCRHAEEGGVPCRCIRYGGIFHGTFDRLGYAPQVEDMLREIASEMPGAVSAVSAVSACSGAEQL